MRSAGRLAGHRIAGSRGAGSRAAGFVAGLSVAGLLTTACGTESAVLDETVPTTDPTDNTEPPAEDEAIYGRIEGLVRDVAELIDQLRQQPEAVNDPEDPDIRRLVAHHTADSPRLDAILDELRDLDAEGHRLVPLPSHPLTEVVLFRHEIIGPDVVQFEYCEAKDLEELDSADDDLVDPLAGVAFGDGEARRVDGTWVIHEMEEWHEFSVTPGRVQARECLIYMSNLDDLPTREDREDQDEDEEDGD